MEDLLIRLIDKKRVVYLDSYDIRNLYVCKPEGLADILGTPTHDTWCLYASTQDKKPILVEIFETEDAAKLALHNVSRALAFGMKYITLQADGNIEERI